MVLEIFQLLMSDETHLKRLKTAGNLLEIPVSWSLCLHSRSYFQGNFQKQKTSKGVIFPEEFLEMCIKPKPRLTALRTKSAASSGAAPSFLPPTHAY